MLYHNRSVRALRRTWATRSANSITSRHYVFTRPILLFSSDTCSGLVRIVTSDVAVIFKHLDLIEFLGGLDIPTAQDEHVRFEPPAFADASSQQQLLIRSHGQDCHWRSLLHRLCRVQQRGPSRRRDCHWSIKRWEDHDQSILRTIISSASFHPKSIIRSRFRWVSRNYNLIMT